MGNHSPLQIRNILEEKTDTDNFYKCVIIQTIDEFHRTHRKSPTLRSLHSVLKTRKQFKGSKDLLWRAVRCLGFRWRKTGDSKLLIEKGEICEMVLNYL
jgi:hypothetical protein